MITRPQSTPSSGSDQGWQAIRSGLFSFSIKPASSYLVQSAANRLPGAVGTKARDAPSTARFKRQADHPQAEGHPPPGHDGGEVRRQGGLGAVTRHGPPSSVPAPAAAVPAQRREAGGIQQLLKTEAIASCLHRAEITRRNVPVSVKCAYACEMCESGPSTSSSSVAAPGSNRGGPIGYGSDTSRRLHPRRFPLPPNAKWARFEGQLQKI